MTQPVRREPVFNVPVAVLGAIAVLVAIHLARQALGEEADIELLARFAFVPGRLTYAIDPAGTMRALSGVAASGEAGVRVARIARFFLGDGSPQPWTPLTYAFLHGDTVHLGLNSLWLLAFGTPIARRFGAWRFVLFLVVASLAGAAMHWVTHLHDFLPVIGASAAVSGCMAASIRFVFQPGAPLGRTLGFNQATGDERFRLPAMPLSAIVHDRRAMTFLVIWFATNAVFGIGSISFGVPAIIAWEAHVGGFLAGLLLFAAFDRGGPYAREAPPTQVGDLG